jgi:hypothetical protein
MTDLEMLAKALRTIKSCKSLTQLKMASRFACLVREKICQPPRQLKSRAYVDKMISSTRDKKVDELIIS